MIALCTFICNESTVLNCLTPYLSSKRNLPTGAGYFNGGAKIQLAGHQNCYFNSEQLSFIQFLCSIVSFCNFWTILLALITYHHSFSLTGWKNLGRFVFPDVNVLLLFQLCNFLSNSFLRYIFLLYDCPFKLHRYSTFLIQFQI